MDLDFSQPLPFKIDRVVKDMSNEEYHSHGSEIISSSFVKGVCKDGSVGHALKPITHSDALVFGSAFHDYMEHDGELPDTYIVSDLDRRTKGYKELVAGNPQAEVIKQEWLDSIEIMYQNTINNEAYQSLFQFGTPIREYSVFGSLNGIRTRVRFDLGFCNGDKSIENLVAAADYKTCKSLKDFEADLNRSVKYKSGWRYDVQDIYYSDFLGIDPSNFYFVAVEKEYPYSTGVYALSEESISRARYDVCVAMDKIAHWKETGDIGNIKQDIIRI